MPQPRPHQIDGALFLAKRRTALLADEQRVGKTGAAIMAADYVLAQKVLVVTTASGRANWGREFRDWQSFERKIQVIYGTSDSLDQTADVVVVGWPTVNDRRLHAALRSRQWNALILDESHYAKNPEAKRTAAIYAPPTGLTFAADRIWCLTGTPVPNAPNDLWPMLNALEPARIDHMGYGEFVRRYCVTRPKFVSGRRIEIVVGGRNEAELAERLKGFWLRRTQKDIGITAPIFSVFSLPNPSGWNGLDDDRYSEIIEAAEYGDTAKLEMHLGTLRRLTGTIKAKAVAETVREEFENGLDKIVLMAWHKETMAVFYDALMQFGVVGIDGSTPPTRRQAAVDDFNCGSARVFVGQILAAGEAIDLSPSCNEMMFVEPSFTPKDMAQAALRITNMNQTKQPYVRVAALAGSIDEPVMGILTRKVSSIKEVMTHAG